MKITREEDYAVSLIAELAAKKPGQPLSLPTVAKNRRLPLLFLKKIAHRLKNAGLIRATEGRAGGYTLARPAQQITLGEILSAFNQRAALTTCRADAATQCPIFQSCPSRQQWNSVSREVFKNLGKIKLSEFITK